MEQSPTEFSTAVSGPTITSELCFQFTSIYFETGSSTVPYIVNASFNVFMALVTTVANILVLSAIRKNTSLHLPSKLLLGNLVLTDLGAGMAVQPMFVTFLVGKVKGFSDICFTYALFGITASILACVSLYIDEHSNKFGPIHRFVLPPQVPRYCENKASFLSSCLHLVVCRILWILMA